MEGNSPFIYKSLHNTTSNQTLGLGMRQSNTGVGNEANIVVQDVSPCFDEESPFKMYLQVSVFGGYVWITLSALSSVARNFSLLGQEVLST